jgi:hypothetical protein
MFKRQLRQYLLLYIFATGLGLSACESGAVAITETRIPETPEVGLPTPAAMETPTAFPGVVRLLTPEGSPIWIEADLLPVLEEITTAAGLELERQSLDPGDERSVRLTVVLADPSGSVDGSGSGEEQTLLIVGGGEGVFSNASLIGGGGWRYDQQGFMAGYIAAMITEDWRVAVVGDSRIPGGEPAMDAFVSGVRFFCGLCRQIYPPFVEMPVRMDMAQYGSVEAIVPPLVSAGVETVYVAPGVESGDLLRQMHALQIQVIGVVRPQELPELGWVASIRPDPGAALRTQWETLLAGEQVQVPMPLQIIEVDETRLSPGRLRLAQETLDDLLDGLIATGVEFEGG